MSDFCNRLREIRNARGFTQKEMAELLMIKPQSYASFEMKDCNPSLKNISKIAALLKVPEGLLFRQVSISGIKELELLIKSQNELEELIQKKRSIISIFKQDISHLRKQFVSFNEAWEKSLEKLEG